METWIVVSHFIYIPFTVLHIMKWPHYFNAYRIHNLKVIHTVWLRYIWTRRQLLFLTCLPQWTQENGPLSVLWTSRKWILRFDLFTNILEQYGHLTLGTDDPWWDKIVPGTQNTDIRQWAKKAICWIISLQRKLTKSMVQRVPLKPDSYWPDQKTSFFYGT
jgi:hypothetical protein